MFSIILFCLNFLNAYDLDIRGEDVEPNSTIIIDLILISIIILHVSKCHILLTSLPPIKKKKKEGKEENYIFNSCFFNPSTAQLVFTNFVMKARYSFLVCKNALLDLE